MFGITCLLGTPTRSLLVRVRNLISCEPALLLAEYKRDTVQKKHQRNTADDMTGFHVWSPCKAAFPVPAGKHAGVNLFARILA